MANTYSYRCDRCGNIFGRKETVNLAKQDQYRTLKICRLCDNCLAEALDFIGVPDVDMDSGQRSFDYEKYLKQHDKCARCRKTANA